MKKTIGKKLLGMLLFMLLVQGLTHCGQKGGLTRPDQTAFAAVSH